MIDLPSKKEKGPAPKPEPKAKKEKKCIRRVSPKQARNIRENKKYYARQRKRKGCICEECKEQGITKYGRNVSHIIGKGANVALYYDDENNFIFCNAHEDQWTNASNGGKTKMKVYEKSQEISTRLKRKYYDANT